MLGLMIVSRAEDFELIKSEWDGSQKLELKSDVLLENVRSVVKQIQVRGFLWLIMNEGWKCYFSRNRDGQRPILLACNWQLLLASPPNPNPNS